MSSVPIMVSDGRRVRGGKRGREDKSGRTERDSRNSKSAKSHGNSLSCWAAQQRRGNTPFAPERYAHHTMKPPSQVGNGENYPSFDSPDRGVASLIMGVGSDAVQQKASLDEAAKQGIVIVGWRKSVFANVTPNAMEGAKVAAMKAIAENMQGWRLADELNRRL